VNQSLYHALRESQIEFDSSLVPSVLFIAIFAVLFTNCTKITATWLRVTAHARVRVYVYVQARVCESIIYDIP
jgi:hypothetical protein